jgi:hypothetical protein
MWNPCSTNFSLQFLSSQPPAKIRKFLVTGFNFGEAIHKRIGELHGHCRVSGEFFSCHVNRISGTFVSFAASNTSVQLAQAASVTTK